MNAGYSGTPLPKKLGIKEGSLVAALWASAHFPALLDSLPYGVRLRSDNKICAIDQDWSGLRFVVRTNDRPPRKRGR